jgi:hypothetical protein
MGVIGPANDWRWWRLQSEQQLTVEATVLDKQIALTVTHVESSSAQSLFAVVEARYYGVDRPEFGGHGQIQRIATKFQLDVLTDAELTASWTPLTGIGDTTHPPDAYGPGTTLAVWRPHDWASPAHDEAQYAPRSATRR